MSQFRALYKKKKLYPKSFFSHITIIIIYDVHQLLRNLPTILTGRVNVWRNKIFQVYDR